MCPSTRGGEHFRLASVNLEITPEPSEEERAAILAALEEEASTSQNLSFEDGPEP
jgi:hypothetical protein